MAELLIKIGNSGPDPYYRDGDIVCAFNQRRIRCVHAQHICHLNNFGFNSDGLRQCDTLAEIWYAETHQYRFERVSTNEILRTDLNTLDVDLLSEKPNARGEYIHVAEHIKQLKTSNFPNVFGTDGHEVWYGGRIDTSPVRLDEIWKQIETHSDKRESAHTKWPLTPEELMRFLDISVTDFDDNMAEGFVLPLTTADKKDDTPVVVKKRANSVVWQDLPGLSGKTKSDVMDVSVEVDIRDTFVYVPEVVVNPKGIVLPSQAVAKGLKK